MKTEITSRRIRSIHHRRILNSHVQFITEYVVELEDGTIGVGSAPKGETTSTYDKEPHVQVPKKIIDTIIKDKILKVPISQEELDSFLNGKSRVFGRENCYALSLAFFAADKLSRGRIQQNHTQTEKPPFPHVCLNILNGGRYAYTNPVLSDFSEFLLVSRSRSLTDLIKEHSQIQRRVRAKLVACHKSVVNGNVVNESSLGNRGWLEFLMNTIDDLHLASKYDIMLDASASNLWTGSRYKFALTDGSIKTSSEMCKYWLDLTNSYKIRFLEDPFHETDFKSWIRLTQTRGKCKVLGDNLYCSDPLKIQNGIKNKYSDGVIIKPDQAGTVTATIQAIRTAQQGNQIVMTSHRSISTESTFLSKVTSLHGIDYIKIGPLTTDYSSIIRLNELIRLHGIG